MASVRFDAVRKTYDNGHIAVAGASFEIADGELLVLVGPSGCGKSTLLRMIAGLEDISSGELSIGSRVVNDLEPKDRDIAMVFQNYALYPHMSVAENLAFGLKLANLARSEIDDRVRAAAEWLELTPMLDRRPAQLSGGQRQRVALGRALVRQPAVFLLDEPLSNLDAKLRLSMRSEIARLHRRLKTTMIYVTHDQTEAMTLGQRIVVLDGGVIQQIDTPMALYERPANLFVAGFLGSPAMNLVRGRVVADDDGIALVGDGLQLRLAGSSDAGAWRQHLDRERVIGLRPEDLSLEPVDGRSARFDATVELVEPVGNEAFINLRAGSHTLIARVPPRTLPDIGATPTLHHDTTRLHVFDPDSGKRIDITAAD